MPCMFAMGTARLLPRSSPARWRRGQLRAQPTHSLASPMLYLSLAVVCYLATSVFQKLASRRGLDAISVNLALRLSGTVLTVVLLAVTGTSLTQPQLPQVAVIGVGSGIFTFLAGYAGLRALDFGTLNATWSVVRASTVVPVLASIIIWGELRGEASPREIAVRLLGVACLLSALVLLGRGPRE